MREEIEKHIRKLQEQEESARKMLVQIRHQIEMEFERLLQETFGIGVGDLITTNYGVARVSGLMRLSTYDFQNGRRPWLLAHRRKRDGCFRDKSEAFYNWEPHRE